ncbi:carboxymuconolactone decarboxylase family protein [Cupriavidus gilardii]|uniref:carboxymuconolactone decarboxylase family protein n=1 Tax=Cupriavidus gilardii TaxID=82541 RepID=UPI0020C61BA9|nr:carboxymuconolactone decarboxylase family protein [Cupriavidus gilardii]
MTASTGMDGTADGAHVRDAIRAEFIRERGYWRPWTETLLREHPAFLQGYARYAGHPARHGPLGERMVELIYVALDASGSHLFEAGVRTHMARAIELGVRPAELFDVLHLVAAQGLDGVTQGAALLAEECGMGGMGGDRTGKRADADADPLSALAALDPAYAAAVRDFLALPSPGAGLTDAEKCLLRVALAACFTAHHPQALRQHLRAGLALGLPPAALLQAIQLGAHLAVHGTALGAQVYASLAGAGQADTDSP